MKASEVLVCDVCRSSIGDLHSGMIFWEPGETPGAPVLDFRLAHKVTCDNDLLDYSAELWWFADPATTLWRLADMTLGYGWSAEQLSRLCLISWAVSVVGKKHRARARGFAQWM
jgi:hypothetical protein